jgi:acyl-CoA synthetase (AMP-forming)/AMP-acid ligase II
MILGKSLSHTAMLYPNRPAIIFEGRSWTHRELLTRVRKLANVLVGLGYRKGDRLAVLGRNSHRYLEASFALALNGICMVPINHRLKPAETGVRLAHAQVSGLMVEPEYLSLLNALDPQIMAPLRERIIVLDDAAGGAANYERLLEAAADCDTWVTVSPEDPLYLGYTSGTTGRAKAAIISHRAIVVGFLYKTIEYGFGTDEVSLNPGYFWHSAPRDFALLQIYLGGTTVVMRDFRPEASLKLMEKYRVNNGFFVPTMFRMMLDEPNFRTFDLTSLRLILSGGAPLPTAIKDAVLASFGAILHEFYAATETRIVTSISAEELSRKTRSVGRPVRDVELRILDDDGRELPPGATGEIFLRTPTLFSGYYNDPEKTASAFRGEWFSLGDMGRLDEEGYLYLVDRKHDVVISGGENIYPGEVEDVLLRHPAIADAAVIGVPDEKWGEALKAIICLRPGRTATADELNAFCARYLADYLKPRSYDVVTELPRNPSGKVLKRELRSPYWQEGGLLADASRLAE